MATNRLEAFSNRVFAIALGWSLTIAITLPVLKIKVSLVNMVFGTALLHLWPFYLAYMVGFLVISAIWINYHAMLHHIVYVDGVE